MIWPIFERVFACTRVTRGAAAAAAATALSKYWRYLARVAATSFAVLGVSLVGSAVIITDTHRYKINTSMESDFIISTKWLFGSSLTTVKRLKQNY